jgi:hypothetical protein
MLTPAALFPPHRRPQRPTEFEAGEGTAPQKARRDVMAQDFIRPQSEGSRINTIVMGTIMTAVLVLAGLLSFAPYSLM